MPQIVNRQPFAEYLEEVDVNASALRAGRRSMLHMVAAVIGKAKPPTDAMRIGTAVHCAVLEPERFEAIATVSPDVDRRTKDGKATYAAWQASLPKDALVLDTDEWDTVTKAADALAGSTFRGMIGNGDAEVSIYWDETVMVHGDPVVVGCKARLDWLGWLKESQRIVIGDIKTTRDATPRAFARSCATYGYAHQLAWYRRAVRALQTSKDLQPGDIDVVIGAVETEHPYATGVYRIAPSNLDTADNDNMRTLTQWAECLRRDIYPGPCAETGQTLFLPEWAFDIIDSDVPARRCIGESVTDELIDGDTTIPF